MPPNFANAAAPSRWPPRWMATPLPFHAARTARRPPRFLLPECAPSSNPDPENAPWSASPWSARRTRSMSIWTPCAVASPCPSRAQPCSSAWPMLIGAVMQEDVLLALDEATSHLDIGSERRVGQARREVCKIRVATPSLAHKIQHEISLRRPFHKRKQLQKPQHHPPSTGNSLCSPSAITSTARAAKIRPIRRVITLMPVLPSTRAIGAARAKHRAVARPITTP